MIHMKAFVLFFFIAFVFDASAQTPFMVCKPGGYSKEDIKNFLFEEDENGNRVLKQDPFVQEYANQYVRVVNHGYLVCKKDYSATTADLDWITDSSYVENHEMKTFMNSKKVGDYNIEFFRDTFTGGVRIHEYDGCRVAIMKDSCANLIEFRLPKLPTGSGVVQNRRPSFLKDEDNAPVPGGGKIPDVSEDVEPLAEAEKVVVDSIKKPTQWGEAEYLKQQQDLAKQVLDSMGLFSQSGSTNNYIVNSFNTTTYVMPSSQTTRQSEDNLAGQYVYYDGYYYPLPSSSNNVCYQNGRSLLTLGAVLNVGGVIRQPPRYSHWSGDRFMFPDGRPYVYHANLGKWELQGGPVYGFDYSWYNNANQYKPETTGYTSNSYPYQRQNQNVRYVNRP